jgi:hypothetical protein
VGISDVAEEQEEFLVKNARIAPPWKRSGFLWLPHKTMTRKEPDNDNIFILTKKKRVTA